MKSSIYYISLAVMLATTGIAAPSSRTRNQRFNLMLRSTDAATVGSGPVVCVTVNNGEDGDEPTEDENNEADGMAGEGKGDTAKAVGVPTPTPRRDNLTSRSNSVTNAESATEAGPVQVCVTFNDQADEEEGEGEEDPTRTVYEDELLSGISRSVCCGSLTSEPASVQKHCKQLLDKMPNVCVGVVVGN